MQVATDMQLLMDEWSTGAPSNEWLLCVSDGVARLREIYDVNQCELSETDRRVLDAIKVVQDRPALDW